MLTLGTISVVASILFAAVTSTPVPPPDLTGLAAIITAAIGVVGFFATIYRGKKNNARVSGIEDAADYVKGIDALTKRLREEMDDMRSEHKHERAQWIEEARTLHAQIDQMRRELNEQVVENYKLRAELATIREQMKNYLTETEYEEFIKKRI